MPVMGVQMLPQLYAVHRALVRYASSPVGPYRYLACLHRAPFHSDAANMLHGYISVNRNETFCRS